MSEEMMLCDAYKTDSKDEMYLFVDKKEGLERVPEGLMTQFANPVLVTTFKLTKDRKMSRAEAPKVMEAIREQGYYLQMPPTKDELRDAQIEAISAKNEKLSR